MLCASFVAGALAPDIGLFPGGPDGFSAFVHREEEGSDFLRVLEGLAGGKVEKAFVEGWRLHLLADQWIHPWVDQQVRALAGSARGDECELWHLRVEWGVDCRLLERGDLDFLWSVHPYFPPGRTRGSLLGEAAEVFLGKNESDTALRIQRGEASVKRWIRWIPRLFLWGGKIRPAHRRGLPLLSVLFDRATRTFGGWLGRTGRCRIPAALSAPRLPSPFEMEEVLSLGEKCVALWAREGSSPFLDRSRDPLEKRRLER